jgi:hypothetical protein
MILTSMISLSAWARQDVTMLWLASVKPAASPCISIVARQAIYSALQDVARAILSNNLTRSHGEATIERFQKDTDLASEFLAAIVKDGDQAELQHAQQLVAKAFPINRFPHMS